MPWRAHLLRLSASAVVERDGGQRCVFVCPEQRQMTLFNDVCLSCPQLKCCAHWLHEGCLERLATVHKVPGVPALQAHLPFNNSPVNKQGVCRPVAELKLNVESGTSGTLWRAQEPPQLTANSGWHQHLTHISHRPLLVALVRGRCR